MSEEHCDNVIRFPGREKSDRPGWKRISTNKVDCYELMAGSAASQDKRHVYFEAKTPDGYQAWLRFPQEQMPLLAESALREMGRARTEGQETISAFECTGFQLGRETEKGGLVITLFVGNEDGEISLLIPAEMPADMIQALQKAMDNGETGDF